MLFKWKTNTCLAIYTSINIIDIGLYILYGTHRHNIINVLCTQLHRTECNINVIIK